MNLSNGADKPRRPPSKNPSRDVSAEELGLRGRLSPGLDPAMRGPYGLEPKDLGLRGRLSVPTGYQRAREDAEARLAGANDFGRTASALVNGWEFGLSDEIEGAGARISAAAQNALANLGFGSGTPYGAADAARATRDVVERDQRRYKSENKHAGAVEVAGEIGSPINWLTGGLGRFAGGGLRGATVAGAAGGLLEGAAKSQGDDRFRDGVTGLNMGALGADIGYVPKRILGGIAERYAPSFARSYGGELADRVFDKATEALITKGVRETANRIRESYRDAGLRPGYPPPTSDAEGAGLRGPQPLVNPGALRGPLR